MEIDNGFTDTTWSDADDEHDTESTHEDLVPQPHGLLLPQQPGGYGAVGAHVGQPSAAEENGLDTQGGVYYTPPHACLPPEGATRLAGAAVVSFRETLNPWNQRHATPSQRSLHNSFLMHRRCIKSSHRCYMYYPDSYNWSSMRSDITYRAVADCVGAQSATGNYGTAASPYIAWLEIKLPAMEAS